MSRIKHWWKCVRNNLWLRLHGYCFKHERMPEDSPFVFGRVCPLCYEEGRLAAAERKARAAWKLETALALRRGCKR